MRAILLFLVCILPATALSQSVVRLLGIVNLAGDKRALLEVPSPWRGNPAATEHVILRPGERQDKLEIGALDLGERTANVRFHGSNMVVRLSAANPETATGYQINLTNAPLNAVLELYAGVANRTLLRHPRLPAVRLTVSGNADDPAAAAQILALALTNRGIAVISDGGKFLQIVPATLADKVQPRSEPFKLSKPVGPPESDLPAGSINFISAHIAQAALVYAELIGRKLDRDASPALAGPLPNIAFMNHTPLTKAEIIYALDVQLAWCGVKMVTMDDKLVRLAHLNEP